MNGEPRPKLPLFGLPEVERVFFRLCEILMVLLLAAMLFMVFGNVTLRWLSDAMQSLGLVSPLPGGILISEEMSRFFFVWLTFIGASAVFKERGHIAVDAVSFLLPASARRALAAVLMVTMGVSVAIVGWHMLTLVPLQHRKMISSLDLPRSWHGIPIVWMSASMAFSALRQLLDPPPAADPHGIRATG